MTRKTEQSSEAKVKEANFYFAIESAIALACSYLINLALVVVFASVFYKPDIIGSDLPGLADAADVLTKTLGGAAKYLWALGLLAAGQSSTMTGTLAGQYVMEGFFGKIFSKPWHRVAITRSIALIPSMLVAVFAVEHFDTMGELLNVLQSLCLPTALIPILKLTSSKRVMGTAFRNHHFWKTITWLLAIILMGFNLFLFLVYLEELPNKILGYTSALLYFAFVAYLSVLKVGNPNPAAKRDIEGYDSFGCCCGDSRSRVVNPLIYTMSDDDDEDGNVDLDGTMVAQTSKT
jgi:Mn2+/Fe2+ NRAMP family transporter